MSAPLKLANIACKTYLFGFCQRSIDPAFALLEEVLEKAVVKEFCPLRLREHGPQQKGQFEGIIERDPVEKEVPEGFDEREECKQDPVYQPLNVIALCLGFDGLERFECRVNEACDASQDRSAHTKEDDQQEHKAST